MSAGGTLPMSQRATLCLVEPLLELRAPEPHLSLEPFGITDTPTEQAVEIRLIPSRSADARNCGHAHVLGLAGGRILPSHKLPNEFIR